MKDNIKLILLALFLFVGQSAWAEIVGGDDCGKNGSQMSWSFDTTTGELHIWGSGEMEDQQQRWEKYKQEIKSVYIDGHVSSIGREAFSGCINLTNVVIAIPATLDEIGDYAFQNCKSLKDFTMLCDDIDFVSCEYHNSNRYTFDGASTDVTLHCTENYLANESDCFEPGHEFGGWKHDTHLSGKNRFGVTWDYEDHTLTLGGVQTLGYENWSGLPAWDYLFNDYEMTTKLVIGGGVKTIDFDAFNTASFQELVLDEGVTTIRTGAFAENYSLEKVTMSSTISAIGAEAFYNCEVLSCIKINSMYYVHFYDNCFRFIAEDGQIVLPVGNNTFTEADLTTAGLLYDENGDRYGNWTIQYSYDSPSLTLQHGLAYDVEEERDMKSLSYVRHIGRSEVGQWLPVCVPFSFYQASTSTRFDIAEIHGIMPTKDTNMNGQIDTNDEMQLVLTPFSGITKPNVCYMIRPKQAGIITLTAISGNTLYPADQTTVELSTSRNKFFINNVYEEHTISPEDNYFCVRGGKLVHPKNGGTVEPFAWVLRADKRNTAGQRFIAEMKEQPLKVVLMNEDPEESSISSITNLIDDLNNFYVPFQKMSEDQIEETVNDVLKKKN